MTSETSGATSAEETGAGPFPMNPTALRDMMKQMLQQITSALSNGDTGMLKNLPMDPTAFIRGLEHIIANLGEVVGSKMNLPRDPASFKKWWEEMMARIPGGQNLGCFTDPATFFKTIEDFAQRTAGSAREAAPGPADLMNPLWWMRKGGETMQRTADMLDPSSHKKQDPS